MEHFLSDETLKKLRFLTRQNRDLKAPQKG
jgi:hypothetical protein